MGLLGRLLQIIPQPIRRTAGDVVTGLGIAASQARNQNTQIVSGGLGSKISGIQNPQFVRTAYAAESPNTPGFNTNIGNVSFGQPYSQNVLGTQTSGGGGGGGGGGQPQQQSSGDQQQYSLPQISQPSGPDENMLRMIEEDYNNTINSISGQEQALNAQLPTATSQLKTSQASNEASLQQEQGSRLSQIGTRESEQQRATQGALEQLRNLYQTVQRQQQATLSAGGISSSSANEAMATLLGRDMAQRVAGEYGTQETVLRNLSDERKRVGDYFTSQVSNLQQETTNKIQEVQNQFNQQLSQLTALRGQASVQKQQARANLYSQFQSQVQAIQQANQQAALSLQTWQSQMNSRLQAANQSAFNLPQAQTNPMNQGGGLTGASIPALQTQTSLQKLSSFGPGLGQGIRQFNPSTGQFEQVLT